MKHKEEPIVFYFSVSELLYVNYHLAINPCNVSLQSFLRQTTSSTILHFIWLTITFVLSTGQPARTLFTYLYILVICTMV